MLAGACAIASCSDDDGSSSDATPTEVSADELGVPDLEVFMNVDATSSELVRVRGEIEADEAIERFAYLDQDAALVEYAEIFGANEAAKIDASELPASFRVTLVSDIGREAIAERYAAMLGVDDVKGQGSSVEVVDASCGRITDAELFLDLDINEGTTSSIEEAIEANPAVAHVRFRSEEEAFEVYECLAEHDPDLAQNTPEALPTSFVLDLVPDVDVRTLRRELESLDGVDLLITRV
jgi:cell division protein FtsX